MASAPPVLDAPALEWALPDAAARPAPPDRAVWALGLTLALAVVLRVWKLDAVGFNSDETVYVGQAASIAHVPALEPFFPIFRAHPLLFQTILSIGFKAGLGGAFERLVAAAFGLVCVLLVHELGRLLYDRRVGLIAALLMAVMPYHVIVSRQVLLDGPMTLCATLALYLMARYVISERVVWLYAAGGALGLTVLSKETGIIFVGAIYAFFALTPSVRVRLADLGRSMLVMAAVIAPYPLALALSGETGTGGHFLAWQLLRRPNHAWDFYATTLPGAVGPLLLIAAAAGTIALWRRRTWRETLLLAWIAAPVVFFTVWPVKGYQYLLPAAPPLALLAARGLSAMPRRAGVVAASLVAITMLVPSWQRIQPSHAASSLAGTGGLPGGREAGRWVRAHVPVGATMLTIGPTMANVLEFYGHRRAYGLSVSVNPLRRNPTYTPLPNPDLFIRRGELQYVVWDAFSAARSPTFAKRVLRFTDRYNGRVLDTESVVKDGTRTPVIVVYEVRP